MTMSVNRRGLWLVEAILAHVQERRAVLHLIEGGGRYIDCGIDTPGGLLLGVELALVCMGDLALVTLLPGEVAGRPMPRVQVVTDHPVRPAWPASTPAGPSARESILPWAPARCVRCGAESRSMRRSAFRRPKIQSLACSRPASRLPPRSWPRWPRNAGSSPRS